LNTNLDSLDDRAAACIIDGGGNKSAEARHGYAVAMPPNDAELFMEEDEYDEEIVSKSRKWG